MMGQSEILAAVKSHLLHSFKMYGKGHFAAVLAPGMLPRRFPEVVSRPVIP